MLFEGGVYDELQTNEGKESLRQNALEVLQEIIKQEVGVYEVEEILFTNSVMQ
jgi:flagellar FliL protein|tara:strand:- start:983 stop:1141 length:159 start_codon:yes stop_codon:yes gene_type:complete